MAQHWPVERQVAARRADLQGTSRLRQSHVLHDVRVTRRPQRQFTRPGRGITVAGTIERSEGVTMERHLVDFARHQGIRRDELVALIESLS